MSDATLDIPVGLVERAQAGDDEALRALVRKAYPLVRRWALVRTGDPSEADDLTQDVLVHVIRKLDTFDASARFTTWLYSVTRNAAVDRFRRGDRRARATADLAWAERIAPNAPESPAAAAERAETRDLLRRFFAELPARQREILDLCDVQGLTSPEAAELLGVEPVTVRAHLFKARRSLRLRILQVAPGLAEQLP